MNTPIYSFEAEKRALEPQREKDEKFTSERLNYFLIANSFLLIAFIYSAIYRQTGLVHLVAALSIFLSLWFLFMQYFASLISDGYTYTKDGSERLTWVKKRIQELSTPLETKFLFVDMRELISNPMGFINKHSATHNWVIPFAFGLLWFFSWWYVAQSALYPVAYCLVLVFLYLYYRYLKNIHWLVSFSGTILISAVAIILIWGRIFFLEGMSPWVRLCCGILFAIGLAVILKGLDRLMKKMGTKGSPTQKSAS